MKIKKTRLNKKDLICKYLPANYTDAFEGLFSTHKPITADDIMIAFWTSSPKWVDKLFALRDWIVKPFGIQGGHDRNKEQFENAIRNFGSCRFIETVDKSDSETVISADDKHLKMYFSIQTKKTNNQQQKLVASTVVHFHNWLGRAYFYIIFPFHSIVVKRMMKYSITQLLSEKISV